MGFGALWGSPSLALRKVTGFRANRQSVNVSLMFAVNN